MGTTIKGIHVFVDTEDIKTVHTNTVNGLQTLVKEVGYETASATEASLSFRVTSTPNSSWISIYQTTQLQHLPNLMTRLSKLLGTLPVLEIGLYDSDVLQIQLAQNGKIVDEFNDWKNYDERPQKRVGNAQIWKNTLPVLNSAQALETAWSRQSKDYPFESEGAMYRIIDLLNIDEWRLRLDTNLDNVPATATVSESHFRYTVSLPYDDEATGLPQFLMNSYQTKAQTKLGRNCDVFFSVMNRGGYGKGVQIELNGLALDNKLVEPVGLITESPFNSYTGEIVAHPEIQFKDDNTQIARFNIEKHPIPAGVADWNAIYKLPHHLRDPTREFELGNKGGSFAIVFKPIETGQGQLTIRAIPSPNPKAYDEFIVDFDVIA